MLCRQNGGSGGSRARMGTAYETAALLVEPRNQGSEIEVREFGNRSFDLLSPIFHLRAAGTEACRYHERRAPVTLNPKQNWLRRKVTLLHDTS